MRKESIPRRMACHAGTGRAPIQCLSPTHFLPWRGGGGGDGGGLLRTKNAGNGALLVCRPNRRGKQDNQRIRRLSWPANRPPHTQTNLGRRKAWQLRTLCSKGRVAGPGQDGPRPPSPKYDRSISIEVRLAILRKADISTKRAHKAARQHGTCIPWGMSMASLLSKGHQVCSVWSRQFGRAAHHISETAGSTAVA